MTHLLELRKLQIAPTLIHAAILSQMSVKLSSVKMIWLETAQGMKTVRAGISGYEIHRKSQTRI